MSGWEELDTAGHTFWLVCFGEDYSIKPDAIFLNEEEAQAYVASRQALPEDDDRHVGQYDIFVLPVRDLAGVAWNSYDPLPEEGGARPGSDRQLRAEVSRLQSLLNTPPPITRAHQSCVQGLARGAGGGVAVINPDDAELLGRLDEIRRDVGLEALLSGVASLMASEANKWQGAHEWAVLTAARHKIEDAEAEVARLWRDE